MVDEENLDGLKSLKKSLEVDLRRLRKLRNNLASLGIIKE